ncbi:hypothetical protein F4860DRAFT_221616 [Xylaria cubensis]|nr:hypothetical protein F4860DRAFT_221616 [Xylaria cubensis]
MAKKARQLKRRSGRGQHLTVRQREIIGNQDEDEAARGTASSTKQGSQERAANHLQPSSIREICPDQISRLHRFRFGARLSNGSAGGRKALPLTTPSSCCIAFLVAELVACQMAKAARHGLDLQRSVPALGRCVSDDDGCRAPTTPIRHLTYACLLVSFSQSLLRSVAMIADSMAAFDMWYAAYLTVKFKPYHLERHRQPQHDFPSISP